MVLGVPPLNHSLCCPHREEPQSTPSPRPEGELIAAFLDLGEGVSRQEPT